MNPPAIVGGVAFKVAIQGEPGSFSHEAALSMASKAEIVFCARSPEVFSRLCSGSVDAAVIPIENSLAGSVLEHYDFLLASPVVITGEHLVRIRHNLIAAAGASLDALVEVYSHPIALDQCREFFRRYPHLRATSFYDTAGSVKHILAGESVSAGAIASRQASLHFGGQILVEGIEDNAENYTRFLLLRRPGSDPWPEADAGRMPAANKVSLCFAVENRPGSLVAALEVFASQATNLTRIESRPVPGSPWQYIFYADYQMEKVSEADAALRNLPAHCSMVKELGRYRAATPPPRS